MRTTPVFRTAFVCAAFAVWAALFCLFLVFRPGLVPAYPLSLLIVLSGVFAILPYGFTGLLLTSARLRDAARAALHFLEARPKCVYGMVAVAVAVLCAWTYVTGAELDYKAHYLVQWKTLLRGENPWVFQDGYQPVTFGPLHLIFAPLIVIHPLLPKFLFLGLLLASVFLIWMRIKRQEMVGHIDDPVTPLVLFLILVPFNPYFWSMSAHFGFNDTFVAALAVFAFALHDKGRPGWAGLCLGIAIFYKIYPVFMLPFLAMEGRGLRLKPVVTAVAVVVGGFALSYAIWGQSTFYPFLFNSETDPKWLSIFRALKGIPALAPQLPALYRLSSIAMAGACGLVALFAYVRNIPAPVGAALGLLAALLFHKVGHVQYLSTFVLLVGFAVSDWSQPRVRAFVYICLPYVLFLTWFAVWYDLTMRYGDIALFSDTARRSVGWIAFPLGMGTLIGALVLARGPWRKQLFLISW